jgi:ribose-phosphate pyrophosphokinase
MNNIRIFKGAQELEILNFSFPGGEVGVKLDPTNLLYVGTKAPYQTIRAHLRNSEDIMRLVMVKDALERLDKTPTRLLLPYVPYGRQDRVCNKGESFSLKAFARLLNSLNFSSVTILDPHSDVTPALIERVNVISQVDIVHSYFDDVRIKIITGAPMLVSPDAGANKKTSALASYFEHAEFIRSDKLRELSTGHIKETIVYSSDLREMDVMIVDDICDGGRTFIELAKALKQKNAGNIYLYVTHGIFSKGFAPLISAGIKHIYTTNSFNTDLRSTNDVTVFDIEKIQ